MKSYFWWPYRWNNMVTKHPIISPMINAIIDDDIEALKQMRAEGMNLIDSDDGTLRRALFEKMESHDLMKLLIEDEYITSFRSAESDFYHAKYVDSCLDENGYPWGLMSRACYFCDYEIMDLLARYRFDDSRLVINRTDYCIEGLIFDRDDLTALRILYENGYTHDDVFNGFGGPFAFYKWRTMYPDKIVTRYLNENLYPKRRSMGLDKSAFMKIDYPYQEKLGLLHRKEIKTRNEYRVLNYQDRIRAQKEYWKWLQDIGKLERWQSYIRADDARDEAFWNTLRSMRE